MRRSILLFEHPPMLPQTREGSPSRQPSVRLPDLQARPVGEREQRLRQLSLRKAELRARRTGRDVNTALDWPIWLAGVEAPDLALGQGPTYSDASLCLDAAIAGQGVFLGWRLLAEDALKAGKLVRPFDHIALTGKHYWLITSNTRQSDMKARLFGEWLKAEMRVLAQSQDWDKS